MKKVTAIFYENSNGKKPVRDWLLSLDKEDRRIIGEDIKTAEYGFIIWIYKKRAENTKK